MATTDEIATNYFEAVGSRDLDRMVGFWKPGGIAYIHGIADLRVPDQYRAWFINLFDAMPDYVMRSLEVLGDEDRAAVRWQASANFTGHGRFEGFKSNGVKIELEGVDVLTFEDGLIVSNHAYTNGMDIARQIGAMPPPGSIGEKIMVSAFNSKTSVTKALKRSK